MQSNPIQIIPAKKEKEYVQNKGIAHHGIMLKRLVLWDGLSRANIASYGIISPE